MATKIINNSLLLKMIQLGANNLSNYKDMINQLNVFPVPDGDTGTNMNLSMQSGVKAISQMEEEEISEILKTYVTGLLMGARGNSGVILSQLFKGFSDALADTNEITPTRLASALENGVKKAYSAVTNPVEGTILTVAKDAAAKAQEAADDSMDITVLMDIIVEEAKRSLEKTPELLPILKEVGVVDSGGKGLVVIYEGFLAALKGEELTPMQSATEDIEEAIAKEHEKSVQSFISADSIEFGYCTEFFIELKQDKLKNNPFHEDQFRNQLSEFGDSLLVASTDELVKIHIHTEYPGKVMTIGQNYGDLVKIDIENMRKQHEAIVEEDEPEEMPEQDTAIISVALGSGMKKMMLSIGATKIIEGGQTMNPSTEEILQAIASVNAKTIFVLPNNKNILLAANQAKELTDKHVIVIPAKSMPQGIAALFAFEESEDNQTNEANMLEEIGEVKTGQVTYATRDTVINGIDIHKDAYIGMNDETIISTDEDMNVVLHQVIDHLVTDEDELLTIFFGEDVSEEEINHLKKYIEEKLDIETEYHVGNQPLYPYILMVE